MPARVLERDVVVLDGRWKRQAASQVAMGHGPWAIKDHSRVDAATSVYPNHKVKIGTCTDKGIVPLGMRNFSWKPNSWNF